MDFYDLINTRNRNVLIAAHRGVAGANIPCNTLEAFDLALKQGADIIELDITKSLDGELFVFHPYMDFPHLGKLIPMQFKTTKAIRKIKYLNADLTKTQYGVSSFDETLDYLKDRCIINIDKFWQNPKKIVGILKRHNLLNSVIIKSYTDERSLSMVRELAPSVPYMAMVKSCAIDLEEKILHSGINLIAEELLFKSINDVCVSNEHIEKLHNNNILVWGNSIVYNYKDVISAGKTDDLAILGHESEVWGWFVDNKFDIIQTDWVLQLKNYLLSR